MGMEIMIEIVGQSHWEFVGMWDMDFDGREKKNPQNGHMRVRPIFMHSNRMV
jgi:hypothetical protein